MNIQKYLKLKSSQCDLMLQSLWKVSNALLIATGGFGREELFPSSDIDVLIVSNHGAKNDIAIFIQSAWNAGLNISHSVRTTQNVIEDTQTDLHFYTSLIESRLICGDKIQYQYVMQHILSHPSWPEETFIREKIKEQKDRHHKFKDNLEPYLKYGIGGQRDIHTLFWLVIKRYGRFNPKQLILDNMISMRELSRLKKAHLFMNKVRFMHEELWPSGGKIRFDQQIIIAQKLGYHSDHKQRDVEYFMKDLLLHMRHIVCITEKIYTHLKVNPNAKYQEMPCLQALIKASEEMNIEDFQSDQNVKLNFLKILRAETGIFHNLRHLSNTEILSKLFPGYRHTLGQMQFDLFHVHSVDVHTLEVIRQIREIKRGKHHFDLPICTKILNQKKDHSTLYLAALFHDMGKGRGVDHAIWGAQAAYTTLQGFPLQLTEVKHISWLVKEHLLLSLTAQKKDISDVNTIATFASSVKTPQRLDDLLVLTVADIRGTNPKLWTQHRATLIKQLYLNTQKYLSSKKTYAISTREITLPDQPIQLMSSSQTGQCELIIHTEQNQYLFSNVTSTIDSLNLNIAWAQTQILHNTMILHRYILLDKDCQTLTDLAIFQDIQKRVSSALKKGTKPPQIQRRIKPEMRAFQIKTEIKMSQNSKKGLLEIYITAADRPGLLCDIANELVNFNLTLHSAKINTIGEKAVDIFWVFNQDSTASINQITHALESVIGHNKY